MSEIVTCIDFGNSFTKVSFRRSADDSADLFEDEENRSSGGEERFCFPSALRHPPRGAKYRANWKPLLFSDQLSDARAPLVGLDALLASQAMGALAAHYRVTPDAIGHLRQLCLSARGLLGVASEADAPQQEVAPPPDDLIDHAVAFFTELRQKLRPHAERKFPTRDFDSFPTRLCLPAFGDGLEGTPTHFEGRFRNILQRAGWRADPESFLTAEPVANIVGVLTQGANQTWCPYARKGDDRRFLHMGRMFDFASLVRAVQRRRPTYTVLSCDVGSYTTDVAVVRFHTTDDPDRRPDIWASSAPLGVAQLDSMLFSVLPEEKASLLSSCPPAERLQWRRRLYGELFPYFLAALDDEVGSGSEMGRIRDVVGGFAGQVARVVGQLLEKIGPSDCQDVILTGGGCEIPKLRNGVLTAVARHFGAGYLVHGPAGTPTRSSKTVLHPRLVRGATALGGASVFFDQSFRVGVR